MVIAYSLDIVVWLSTKKCALRWSIKKYRGLVFMHYMAKKHALLRMQFGFCPKKEHKFLLDFFTHFVKNDLYPLF